uniref:Uncharacterized protein n=1 Tax=Magallana gigas TaxID=29159 RepID=K1RL51_MAGGI
MQASRNFTSTSSRCVRSIVRLYTQRLKSSYSWIEEERIVNMQVLWIPLTPPRSGLLFKFKTTVGKVCHDPFLSFSDGFQ